MTSQAAPFYRGIKEAPRRDFAPDREAPVSAQGSPGADL